MEQATGAASYNQNVTCLKGQFIKMSKKKKCFHLQWCRLNNMLVAKVSANHEYIHVCLCHTNHIHISVICFIF